MCLGIPGQLVELLESHEHLARVDVNGVGRVVNIGLLEDEPLVPGDWVLIHVGFAMSKIDEAEAAMALDSLRMMGAAYTEELDALDASRIVSEREAERAARGLQLLMRFVDEYRDPVAARALVGHITELAAGGSFKFMEVCGGHTHTIYRHGIEHVLPDGVELVHGPGCPVCVIPMGRVDDAIAVAEHPGVDLHVLRRHDARARRPRHPARGQGPGRRRPLRLLAPRRAAHRRSRTRSTRSCSSPSGFETTAPSTALTLLRARQLGVTNFSVFCNHVTIVPPIKAILESPDLRLDGFLGPGHVSTVVGNRPVPVRPAGVRQADRHRRLRAPRHPAGRSPCCCAQIREGRCEVENQYSRVVRDEGNPKALQVLAEVFELRPALRVAGPRVHLPQRPQAPPRVRRLRRRAPLRRARRAGRRPEGVPVRRGAQGRDQAVGVQGLRDGLHAGDPDRHVHGVLGGRLRGLLQLRPPPPRRRRHPRPRQLTRQAEASTATRKLQSSLATESGPP